MCGICNQFYLVFACSAITVTYMVCRRCYVLKCNFGSNQSKMFFPKFSTKQKWETNILFHSIGVLWIVLDEPAIFWKKYLWLSKHLWLRNILYRPSHLPSAKYVATFNFITAIKLANKQASKQKLKESVQKRWIAFLLVQKHAGQRP